MAENALLYELLINKQKMKPLNSNSQPKTKEEHSLIFNLGDTNDANNILDSTNQIFKSHCKSSNTVKDNVSLFNDFLEAELPLLINKFEKYCIGKTE
jgi:hypothetical protein